MLYTTCSRAGSSLASRKSRQTRDHGTQGLQKAFSQKERVRVDPSAAGLSARQRLGASRMARSEERQPHEGQHHMGSPLMR